VTSSQSLETPIYTARYGNLAEPDREKLLRWVADEIQKQPGLDFENGDFLDVSIDNDKRDWVADISHEYERRVGSLDAAVKAATVRVDNAKKRLRDLDGDYRAAKESRAVAYEKMSGRPYPEETPDGTPGTAVVPQLPAAARTAPPVGIRQFPHVHGAPSAGEYVHLAVLAIAAIADLVAFNQVLALVLGSYPIVQYCATIAVTVLALGTMHVAGQTWRDVWAREGGRMWIVIANIVGWFVLGTAAFLLRLLVHDGSGGGASLTNIFGTSVGQDNTTVFTKALIFGAIFLVTGLVALVGAYITRHKWRSEYRAARKHFLKIKGPHDAATAELHQAESDCAVAQRELDSEPERRRAAEARRGALACMLKSRARIEIAKRLTSGDQIAFLMAQPIPGCPKDPEVANGMVA
jgi:hypothetical protein